MQTVPYPAPTRNSIAYHASFDGQHGQSLRPRAVACWFLADEGSVVLLHDDDAPYLQLHGRVDLAREQRLLDDLRGGLYQLVDMRNSHRPRLAV
jgi:hypothetical protein